MDIEIAEELQWEEQDERSGEWGLVVRFPTGLVLYYGEEDQRGGAEAKKGEGHWSSRLNSFVKASRSPHGLG